MADQDPRSTYIDYVQNVLGVKTLMRDSDETAAAVARPPLLVRVQGLTTYNEAEKDLLSKMLAALKIDSALYVVVDAGTADGQAHPGQLILDFADDRTESADHVLTYSPRTLVQKPELKKVAWADLQRIIAAFQRS